MKIRPTSVTVIPWILIVLWNITGHKHADVGRSYYQGIYGAQRVSGCCSVYHPLRGVACYNDKRPCDAKGTELTRLLYVIWGAVGGLIGVATSPMKTAMIPGFVI